MTIKVNVQDVVSELEVQDEATVYLNKNTGEFVLVTDELAGALDRDISANLSRIRRYPGAFSMRFTAQELFDSSRPS